SASTGIGGIQRVQDLPWSGSAKAGDPVTDVDVAVGVYHTGDSSVPKYFVLAVYESKGEIFLEHYNINIDWNGVTFEVEPEFQWAVTWPPTFPVKQYQTNNPRQLSNSSGTAGYPHIDLVYDGLDLPAAGVGHRVIGYAVTW